MNCRLAIKVKTVEECKEQLEQYIKGVDKAEDCWIGDTEKIKADQAVILDEKLVSEWIANRTLNKLAELWVKGRAINWSLLYQDDQPQRIALPFYPFAQTKYWFYEVDVEQKEEKPGQKIEKKIEEKSGALKIALPDMQLKKMIGAEKHRPVVKVTLGNNIESSPKQASDSSKIKEAIKELLSKTLGSKLNEIKEDKKFIDLGLDSIAGVEWIKKVNDHFGINLTATKLYDYPTVTDLTQYIHQITGSKEISIESSPQKQDIPDNPKGDASAIKEKIKTSLADTLYLKRENILEQKKFIDLGLDSIVGVEWIEKLNKLFGTTISATKLYDYPTVEDLSHYINDLVELSSDYRVEEAVEKKTEIIHTAEPDKIAVVGMSGRYPGANDLTEFWNNLKEGVDSVRVVPRERWDVDRYYDSNPQKKNKIYAKWLGALDDIDQFDPLFFNISPSEAECMDPQHRIYLQEAWKALEDAGYPGSQLSGVSCGIYVGIMGNEYADLLNEHTDLPASKIMTGNSSSIFSGRMAYHLNLKGPAIAMDTACSSSLVAVHLACEALRHGEVNMAMAGGVSLYLTVKGYQQMCDAQMLSPEGKCKTFSQNADGFVPGEGAGVVILKRLADAEKDGDRIHGIILGSGINQDGKTNGITAPSPQSQAALEKEIYEKYHIDPAALTYIEAHGTGTKLGDPIECEALNEVFSEYTSKKHYCGIGSVKSNVGHTSAAAGVAGIQKLLLMFHHQKMVPSLHAETTNEHINFDSSPFYITRNYENWVPPEGLKRRGAVSAFGFSGTNAHLVMEEYLAEETKDQGSNQPVLIVLSAKTKERLQIYVQKLFEFLTHNLEEINLAEMAYTLQTGREAMGYRLACEVQSLKELNEKLKAYCRSEKVQNGFWEHQVKNEVIQDDRVNHWIAQKKLAQVAEQWVKGVLVDWTLLYGKEKPQKISLPAYPFEKNSYWLPQGKETKEVAQLHPLVHQNTSTLERQEFTTVFSGSEPFLQDHQILGEKVLPGMAYLEMACFAAQVSSLQKTQRLHDIVWLAPLRVDDHAEDIKIYIGAESSGMSYEVVTGDQVIHSQGKISLDALASPASESIETILARCSQACSPKQCYTMYRNMGIDYGKSFQGIQTLHYNEREVLAKIQLPAAEPPWKLIPGMMDSAIHASIGLAMDRLGGDEDKPYVPFMLKEVLIYDALPETIYSHITYSSEAQKHDDILRYDISLLNEQGKAILAFKELTVRQMLLAPQQKIEKEQVLYAERKWVNKPLSSSILDQMVVHNEISFSSDPTPQSIIKLFLEKFIEIKNLLSTKLKTPHALIYTMEDSVPEYATACLAGLLKTAGLENPKLKGKIIRLPKLKQEERERILKDEAGDREDVEIRYLSSTERQVKQLSEIFPPEAELKDHIKPEGVYWITGGAGGLGIIFGEYFSQVKDVKIILSGRSEKPSIEMNFDYVPCDVSKLEDVQRVVQHIEEKYGKLNGIIHSAGIIRDNFILKKTEDEVRQVMVPKVEGAWNLHQIAGDRTLDFIVFFSSIAGALGNLGQADYAGANAFMDAFAEMHNYTSINWPLWKEGGMNIDEASEEWLYNQSGIRPLTKNHGCEGLMKALSLKRHGYLLCEGDLEKLRTYLGWTVSQSESVQETKGEVDSGLQEQVEQRLVELCVELLKVKPEDVDHEVNLAEYGVDSILMMNMLNALEADYGQPIPPNAIAEYSTIQSLANYLIEEGIVEKADAPKSQTVIQKTIPKQQKIFPSPKIATRFAKTSNRGGHHKIAIIGQACRLPQSPNLEAFWKNLSEGRDLISEKCEDRWDTESFFSKDQYAPNKTYTNHGGYLNDIAGFDARYFKLSDNEALTLDPQHRIALELAQELFDRSGFAKEELKGSLTSVFIGAKDNGYIRNGYSFIPDDALKHTIVNNISNMIAARISDFYNLKGQSLVIDTACSSSLVAVHQACQSIIHGESQLAVAGGIYLIVDPFVHIGFSQAKVLSDDGKSYVFDERAKGFVLGEGAGFVLLKDYDQAEADGDQISGIILGSAVNNDGQTMGLTVPNQQGQKAVIEEALRHSEVHPETISYLEAHGTGTLLGDPIEIKAATEVYRQQTEKNCYCAVGSVKSNLGHTMTAAGIAGLIKILLSMQHKKIPATLHCENPHPRFGFDRSPFYPNTQLKDWESKHGVRRAAISSFGFGGTNCHMILEGPEKSYQVKRQPLPLTRFTHTHYWLGHEIEHHMDNVLEAKLPEAKAVSIASEADELAGKIEIFLCEKLSSVLNTQPDDIDPEENFMDLGVDSTQLIGFSKEIEESLSIELYPTLFFEYPNIKSVSEYFTDEYKKVWQEYLQCDVKDDEVTTVPIKSDLPLPVKRTSHSAAVRSRLNFGLKVTGTSRVEEPIAVIGMAGRFPKADTLEEYWQNLMESKDCITEIPHDRWDWKAIYGDGPGQTKAKWGSFVNDIDKFDPLFFGISPREAAFMDPQQRLLMQTVCDFMHLEHALEERALSAKGVSYGDSVTQDYSYRVQGQDIEAQTSTWRIFITANRISYWINVQGPSLDTACSSA